MLRTIAGVPTSITGFIGPALKGPLDKPVRVNSYAEYERHFGGLWKEGPLSYAVGHYFLQGGQAAVIVRVRPSGREAVEMSAFRSISDPGLAGERTGLWAFDKADQKDKINLLCIPPFTPQVDVDLPTWRAALAFCKERGIFLLVDPPSAWNTVEEVTSGIEDMDLRDENAALYFPHLWIRDPLEAKQKMSFPPCGAVAGIIASADRNKGVWKAPSGPDAKLYKDFGLSQALDEVDSEALNRIGVNSLRALPGIGPVIWGARTLAGTEGAASDWKYISVRRTALFLEASLSHGLGWVVIEPNDAPLWAQIRQSVGGFMQTLYRKGAFAGERPEQAYFVKCGRATTMTQHDIDTGKVNLQVGFAPHRPAEFIILKFQFLSK